MNFVTAVKSVFSNYSNFKGRARRSEYWWFVLFTMICGVVLSFLPDSLSTFYNFATLVPSLAVLVRRLHDMGKSGWYALLFYAPLVAAFVTGFSFVGETFDALAESERMGTVLVMPSMPPLFIVSLLMLLTGSIYLIVLLCMDSERTENKWGLSPKYGEMLENEIDEFGQKGNNE